MTDITSQDQKQFERKPIFNYQPKSTNVPAALSTATATTTTTTTSAAAYPYLRDDLRPRNKYSTGTVNTEVPQKSAITKNTIFPPGYQQGRTSQGYEVGSYYNNSGMSTSVSTGVGTTSASYLTSGNQNNVTNENYIKGDLYSSKMPVSTSSVLSNRGNTSSVDNVTAYQAKSGALKK